MVSFLEICRRAATGPIVAPDDFDMERLVPNLQKAIAQHGLKAPPKDVVIPWDDDLADRIFLAAKDFVVETGVYCPDTNRVICFTRDELEEAIHFAPRECWLGEGKDRAVRWYRTPIWSQVLDFPRGHRGFLGFWRGRSSEAVFAGGRTRSTRTAGGDAAGSAGMLSLGCHG